NRVARERLAVHAELIFAADPADLSLLAYLDRLGRTGGFMPRGPELPGGGRERYFTGGAQELATRLAANLDVLFGSPVTAIDEAGPEVRVRTSTQLTAKRVVLAVPPALVRNIAVELAAPARRLVDAAGTGGVVKCFAAYATPFWRTAGWSGEVYRPTGPVRATIATGSVLVAFVVGGEAARWGARDPGERKATVLDILAEEFGDEARAPIDYVEADWAADPWSAGCVATTPPNVLARGAAWTSPSPHGRIHIAGTESASVWPGYMEGAIEAGERAAAEVLAALR
ncbi:MAG TPA: FAD-dependent oxidoreductase, partial [Kofleriaceae bacterium]|nr:FAD-dependent oxidoreductase [Kofleriaceae bacterium]